MPKKKINSKSESTGEHVCTSRTAKRKKGRIYYMSWMDKRKL